MIYYFTFVYFLFLSFLYKKDKNFLVIFFLSIFLFWGLMFHMGLDWPAYYEAYYNSGNKLFEYGFSLYTTIFSSFLPYEIYQLSITIFISIFIFNGFKKIFPKNYIFAFTIYIFLFGNRLFVSTLRQGMATGIMLYGLGVYVDNKRLSKKSFLLLVFACLFHISSIISFIFVIFSKIKFSRYFYLFSTILVFLMALFGIDFGKFLLNVLSSLSTNANIVYKLLYYGDSVDKFARFSIFDCIYFIFFFLYLILINKKFINNLFVTIYFIALCVNYLFPSLPILNTRMLYYFFVGYFYVIGKIVYMFRNDYFNKIIYVALIGMAIGFYTMIYVPGGQDYKFYNPYKNILFELVKQGDNYAF